MLTQQSRNDCNGVQNFGFCAKFSIPLKSHQNEKKTKIAECNIARARKTTRTGRGLV